MVLCATDSSSTPLDLRVSGPDRSVLKKQFSKTKMRAGGRKFSKWFLVMPKQRYRVECRGTIYNPTVSCVLS